MNYKLILISLIFIIHSCIKEEIDDDSRLNTKIMILGHMGMGISYSWPGNSKESITACLQIGCDGSEMDVQMTKDSVLVAYHDDDLSSQTSCVGKIHESNWKDIQQCQYNKSVNSAKLTNIDDLFASINQLKNFYFSFDCKVNAVKNNTVEFQKRYLRAVSRLLKKYQIEEQVFLEGPKDFLLLAKEMQLKTPLFLLSNNDDSPSDIALNNGLFGISIPFEASEKDIEYASKLKIRTMVWSPDNYNQSKNVLLKKPDIIQTDDPYSILKLCKRFNYEAVRP